MSKQKRESNRAERAAAIQAAQARKERNVKIVAVVAVLAVISAIVAFAVISSSGGDDSADDVPVPQLAVKDNVLYAGKPSAKVKVVVYEDFLCPFCRQFEESSRKSLRTAAKDGKVYIEYRPFHVLEDDYSKRSLEAYGAVLMNAGAKDALKYHDLLYDKQPYENAANKPDTDQLVSWAKDSGASSSKVTDAIKKPNPAFYDESVAATKDIKSTPTIVVDGKVLPGPNVSDMVDQLKQAIDAGN